MLQKSKRMQYRNFHQISWNFISFCFVSFILFFLMTGLHFVFANEIKQYGIREGQAQTSSAQQQGKEGNMSDIDQLTEEEGRYLLSVARKTIEQKLFNRKDQDQSDPVLSSKFSERRGTFVTLTIDGCLRGCIGHIIPQESLIEGIRINALNAAFQDPRFRPLARKEWEKVKIEISILTEPEPLPYSDADELLKKLRPGVDGVIIKKGHHQSTFLPQVWEQLPDRKEFLTHLTLKAGLDGNVWKNEMLEVSTYQVQAFHEP